MFDKFYKMFDELFKKKKECCSTSEKTDVMVVDEWTTGQEQDFWLNTTLPEQVWKN